MDVGGGGVEHHPAHAAEVRGPDTAEREAVVRSFGYGAGRVTDGGRIVV